MVWLCLQSRPPVVWVLLRLFSMLTPCFFLTNANDRFGVVFLWVQSHSSFLRCTILFRKKQKARHSDASHSETLRHLLEHTPKCRGHCVFLTVAESSSFFPSLSRPPASSSQPQRIPFPTVPPVSLSLQSLPSTLSFPPPVSIFAKHSFLPSCFHLCQAFPSPLLFPSLSSIPFSPPVSIFVKHSLLPSCFHLCQAFPSPLLFPSLPSIPFSPPVSIFAKHSLLPSCFHLCQEPHRISFPTVPLSRTPLFKVPSLHFFPLPSCLRHLCQAHVPHRISFPAAHPVSIFSKFLPSDLSFPPPVSISAKHPTGSLFQQPLPHHSFQSSLTFQFFPILSCFHFYQAPHYHWRELPQV